MGYQVGTRTMVDVLVEQSKFFATKRDYARARYDYLLNGLLLKQAAGTLVRMDVEAVNGLIQSSRNNTLTPDGASQEINDEPVALLKTGPVMSRYPGRITRSGAQRMQIPMVPVCRERGQG